ncbi:MAG TPA: DUF1697 domain-containing protein [Microbacterium sp.]|nr:DUF1697 domain-containing protein [Microbacterium sp.]
MNGGVWEDDAVHHVAFFRNVNQGQRGHPSTSDLLRAFADIGVGGAVPFQSNGTVVFTADDGQRVADGVREGLAARGVFDDGVYARPLEHIELLVDRSSAGADAGRTELTLFPVEAVIVDEPAAARAGERRRCRVVEHGPGFAVVVNDHDRQSNGTPTIEAVLGVPATSRGMPTLLRLIDRFGR